MNYYTSDLHLGHANIIKHSHRPFVSVEEMDRTLIDNYNSRVTDNDDVYILGDISFRSVNIEDYLKQLHGKKHLIIGNHDKEILKNRSLQKYFVEIRDLKTITDDGAKIVLCHYPLVEWDGYYHGALHFYGHIHNNMSNPTNQYITSIPNAYNVGVDILGFTPRTKQEILQMRREVTI